MDSSGLKPCDWIQLGAAIGTVLAALISAFALFELQKTRKQAIRPFLSIDRVETFHNSSRYSNNYFSINFKTQNHYVLPLHPFESFPLSISNIGNGTAVNIQLDVDFEIDKLIDLINKLNIIAKLDEVKTSLQHLIVLKDRNINIPIFSAGYSLFSGSWSLPTLSKGSSAEMNGQKRSMNLLAFLLIFCRQLYMDRPYPYSIPDFLENYYFKCRICYADIEGNVFNENFKAHFKYEKDEVIFNDDGLTVQSRKYYYSITFSKLT